ncbi:alcohol acetyltransferase [Geomicrobium sp. JSM 1781026]
MDQWYKIDNAGKVFHAVSERANSSVFRIAMIMNEHVQPDKLQTSLDHVMKRFPMFAVKLGRGVFWDFLVENDKKLFVKEESTFPCSPVDPIETNGYLFRVLYYKKRISVEFFHSVTDGTGALEFLKALVFDYLNQTGEQPNNDGTVIDVSGTPSEYELDDSYQNYKSSDSSKRTKEENAYQIKGKPIEETVVIHGVMSALELRKAAKTINGTITTYLTSVLIMSIYREKLRFRNRSEPIKIAIPVNLRSIFPSKSLRNFFAVVNVGMEVTEETSLEMIHTEVVEQLKKKTEQEKLQQGLNHHVKLQNMLTARFVPAILKYQAIRYGYKSYGERTKTLTLTNIGNISLPKDVSTAIEQMEMVMYPTRKSPINGGICSINDRFVISFARSIEESDVIRAFFTQLVEISGIDVEVYSNDGG